MQYRLSHSQLELMKSCPRKYWHQYVMKTQKDHDYVQDKKALVFGSIVHYFCSGYIKGDLREVDILHWITTRSRIEALKGEESSIYDDEETLAKIAACCQFGANFIDEIGTHNFVVSELRYDTPFSTAIIDAIIKWEGKYYIVDFKTASITKTYKAETAKITTDPQLNLYSYFFDEIMTKLGVKDAVFGGVAWVQLHKSGLGFTKKYTEMVSLRDRILAESETPHRVICAKACDLRANEFVDNFNKLAIEAAKLREAKEEPLGDFSSCMGMFRNEPCAYWSRCHGTCYSDPKGLLGFPTDALHDDEDPHCFFDV